MQGAVSDGREAQYRKTRPGPSRGSPASEHQRPENSIISNTIATGPQGGLHFNLEEEETLPRSEGWHWYWSLNSKRI